VARSTKRTARRKLGASRKRLTPRKDRRGLRGDEVLLGVDGPELAALSARIRELGGAPA
jgi:hypothetical protein